ncbi:MAG: phage holin [Streptococcus lutetiensis]|uniref:phage holin n=1 Tax=Streptococcus lutetiensis TaxID=150055 RepID=UPI000E558075|nr:phage holin [Streptococcus lutetiensis]RHF37843.1 phage holin [Streptococcus lutetiensis]UVY57334.1 MAG: holin [Bacteriophage sp.]HEP4762653.1 phage holin [Streptococcus pyogenes]HEQ1419462.1 phage holin [Streptococcus pyogenes]
MNDVILQGIMLILTGFAGFIVKTVKDYLFKEGGEKALRIVEIVAKNAVNAVEQIANEDTKGEQKLNAAKTKVKKGLEQYNIYLTDSQLEMFIEAAVKEMNDSWKGESK